MSKKLLIVYLIKNTFTLIDFEKFKTIHIIIFNLIIQMTFPNSNSLAYTNTIQGVILAEIACTFFLYLLLKIIHYLRWGYEEDQAPKEGTLL